MQKEIHREMAFQVICDYAVNPDCLEFLIEGVASPLWSPKDRTTRIRHVKDWMDMPDSKVHSSKSCNDHSYKIERDDAGRFHVCFAKTAGEQATVVARLKYAARDVREWKQEDEYRVCCVELLKSIHWVIDFSSPAHASAGWKDNWHSNSEKHFDTKWKEWYDKKKIKFDRKQLITNVYGWARGLIERSYDRNIRLRDAYAAGKCILDRQYQNDGRQVILDIAQHLADYLSYCEEKIRFADSLHKLCNVNRIMRAQAARIR